MSTVTVPRDQLHSLHLALIQIEDAAGDAVSDPTLTRLGALKVLEEIRRLARRAGRPEARTVTVPAGVEGHHIGGRPA